MRYGITMVKDESDIIGWTLTMALNQLDHVIVADNGSSDGTREILNGIQDVYGPHRLTIVDDPVVGYYQDKKMTALAHKAGEAGATWVCPFDADEAWLYDKDLFLDDDIDVVYARSHVFLPGYSMSDVPLEYMNRRMKALEPLPKVYFRYHPSVKIHMGNHDVSFAAGVNTNGFVTVGTMRHYQYRSLGQVKRKVRQGTRAYEATTLSKSYGSHWRELAALDDVTIEEWWKNYLAQPTIVCADLPYNVYQLPIVQHSRDFFDELTYANPNTDSTKEAVAEDG